MALSLSAGSTAVVSISVMKLLLCVTKDVVGGNLEASGKTKVVGIPVPLFVLR